MAADYASAWQPREDGPPRFAPLGGVPARQRVVGAHGRKTLRRLLEAGLAELDERGFHAVSVAQSHTACRRDGGPALRDHLRCLPADAAGPSAGAHWFRGAEHVVLVRDGLRSLAACRVRAGL